MPGRPRRAHKTPVPAYRGHNCTKRCLGILPNNGCCDLVCWDFLTLQATGTLKGVSLAPPTPQLSLPRSYNSLVSSRLCLGFLDPESSVLCCLPPTLTPSSTRAAYHQPQHPAAQHPRVSVALLHWAVGVASVRLCWGGDSSFLRSLEMLSFFSFPFFETLSPKSL